MFYLHTVSGKSRLSLLSWSPNRIFCAALSLRAPARVGRTPVVAGYGLVSTIVRSLENLRSRCKCEQIMSSMTWAAAEEEVSGSMQGIVRNCSRNV